jgi:hypothetical protein
MQRSKFSMDTRLDTIEEDDETEDGSIWANKGGILRRRRELGPADIIDKEMYEVDVVDNNKNDVHTALHPDINFKLNSINILVGQTGNGKSRAVFTEVAKQSIMAGNPYSQFFYVTDLGSDETFEKYKDKIRIPVIKLKYAEAHTRISELAEAKSMYRAVRLGQYKIRKEEAQGLLHYLAIPDFKLPVPHTIILFDDATNIFGAGRKKKDPFQDAFFLCNRHNHFTYFFNIHSYNKNNISMEIKRSASALWYFGGFSERDFTCFYQQFNSSIPCDKLWDFYQTLGRRDVLLFSFDLEKTKTKVIYLSQNQSVAQDVEDLINPRRVSYLSRTLARPRRKAQAQGQVSSSEFEF